MKRILIALSIFVCAPQIHAEQIRAFDMLVQQIETQDITRFQQIVKKTKLTSHERAVLLEHANNERQQLRHAAHRIKPETWSDMKSAGWGSLLLVCSAIMAAPVVMSGIRAKGDIKKFLDPDSNMVYALFSAMNLAQTVVGSQNHFAHTSLWSSSTLKFLFPQNKFFGYLSAACLYLICASGSAVAAYEGILLLKKVLFDARATAQKLKNVEKMIDILQGNKHPGTATNF